MTKKTKPANRPFKMPTINITSVASKIDRQHISDYDGFDRYTITFPAEVTIKTQPPMSMKGVGSVIINGVRFMKPFEL